MILEKWLEELRRAGFRIRPAKPLDGMPMYAITRGADRFLLALRYGHGEADAMALSPEGRVTATERTSMPVLAFERFAAGEGTDPAASRPAGPAGIVVMPSRWYTAKLEASGELTLGSRGDGSARYVALAMTGSPGDETEASPNLAAHFPERLAGLWCKSAWPPDDRRNEDLFCAGIERRLARAHQLSVPALRRRLADGVGARATAINGVNLWDFICWRADRPRLLRTLYLDSRYGALRAPDVSALAGKRVALVGCGAVGWTVARQLVRAGLRDIVLIDDDRIGGFNLGRLDAPVWSAGLPKASALAEELVDITPEVHVRSRSQGLGKAIGWPTLVDDRPDVIVDLTADERAADHNNTAAVQLGCPAIFAWLSNGAEHARMFRVIPGRGPCYECVRERGVKDLASDGPIGLGTWRGGPIAVNLFATLVAQKVLQTLLGERTPEHLLLDLRGNVPTATSLAVARVRACEVCA